MKRVNPNAAKWFLYIAAIIYAILVGCVAFSGNIQDPNFRYSIAAILLTGLILALNLMMRIDDNEKMTIITKKLWTNLRR